MSKAPSPLWDIPTRVFHWLIVCCLPLAWLTAETDNYEAHQWIGYTVITLVLFRVAWGFVGSGHSRFRDFVVGPGRVLAYLRGGEAGSAGHNPAGGWSVLALLSLLLLQAVSGLFNSDDVLFSGPLYYAASVDLRDAMGVVHEVAFNLLLALVALHIMAVLYHQLVLGERLLGAMIRGRAEGRDGILPTVPWWRALIILALIALALWWGLEQAPQPAPIMW